MKRAIKKGYLQGGLAGIALFVIMLGGTLFFSAYNKPQQQPTPAQTQIESQIEALSDSTSTASTTIDTTAATLALATTTPTPADTTTTATSTNAKLKTTSNISVVTGTTATSSPKQTIPQPTTSANRAPITARLGDQTALFNSTAAVVCVDPFNGVTGGNISTGTGIIVNQNGYILTNAHVIDDMKYCFVGRKHIVPEGFQARVSPPTIAIYYRLQIIAVGTKESSLDPTEESWASSTHDFAILKIGDKIPRSIWNADDAPLDIRTLNYSFLPLATDAEYAAFPQNGPFTVMNINYNYQPVIGDLLSLGGYIGSNGNPEYLFADGKLFKTTISSLVVNMPTGQGFSGSPIVDNTGAMVALNHATDCSLSGGCIDYGTQYTSIFLYGNNSLALSIPTLDASMKADLGYGLKQLQTMQ